MKRIQKKSVILTSLIFTIILLLNLIPFSAKAEELAHLAWARGSQSYLDTTKVWWAFW